MPSLLHWRCRHCQRATWGRATHWIGCSNFRRKVRTVPASWVHGSHQNTSRDPRAGGFGAKAASWPLSPRNSAL